MLIFFSFLSFIKEVLKKDIIGRFYFVIFVFIRWQVVVDLLFLFCVDSYIYYIEVVSCDEVLVDIIEIFVEIRFIFDEFVNVVRMEIKDQIKCVVFVGIGQYLVYFLLFILFKVLFWDY